MLHHFLQNATKNLVLLKQKWLISICVSKKNKQYTEYNKQHIINESSHFKLRVLTQSPHEVLWWISDLTHCGLIKWKKWQNSPIKSLKFQVQHLLVYIYITDYSALWIYVMKITEQTIATLLSTGFAPDLYHSTT